MGDYITCLKKGCNENEKMRWRNILKREGMLGKGAGALK